MRAFVLLGAVIALSPAALPATALAQGAPPPGSYQRQCSNIRMENGMLHATCRAANGRMRVSSLNPRSCGSDIGVDAQGGLICFAPGVAPPFPPAGRPQPPIRPPAGWGRDAIVLFAAPGMRGPSLRLDRPMANLDRTGFNDRTASIRLERRSGPWIVCSDADYRGRCVTIRRSVGDLRQLGLRGAISSVRPAR